MNREPAEDLTPVTKALTAEEAAERARRLREAAPLDKTLPPSRLPEPPVDSR